LLINQNFKSVTEILKAFPDEQACMTHLETIRWDKTVVSPFNPYSKVYFCNNNKYRCKDSGKYFNVKTGTLFYNSKVNLQKWFIAIWLVTSEKKGITSIELSKDLKITQKTAWFMIQRIKKYITLQRKAKSTKSKSGAIDKIVVEKAIEEGKKLQLLDWLKLMKK